MTTTTTKPLRALIVLRLSHSTLESTSIERQEEMCRAYCLAQGWEVVYVATDVDVSGAMSPFDRDGFGPWLTDRPPQPWDVAVAAKLDRVTRSAVDGWTLLTWLRERGKGVATVMDSINTFSPYSDIIFSVMVACAQSERTTTQERLLDTRQKLRRIGRHGSGPAPYPYRLRELDDGGYVWEQDPNDADIMREVIQRRLAGEATSRIADDLTRRGVKPPRATSKRPKKTHTKWHTASLTRLLRSPTLMGYSTHEGKIVTELGEPTLFANEPILGPGDFRRLQDAMGKQPYEKTGRSFLAGIATCSTCGQPLRASGQGRRMSYVCRNPDCPSRVAIVRSAADERVLDIVGEMFANVPYTYQELIYPDTTPDELVDSLEEVKASLARLMDDREAGLYETEDLRLRFRGRHTELTSKQSALENQLASVQTEPTVVMHETEEMWSSRFARADLDERHHMIEQAGLTIRIEGYVPGGDPRDRVIVQQTDNS